MFRFHRWYLDLITNDGAAFVGCMVRLRVHGMSAGYAWTALALPSGDEFEASDVRRACEPSVFASRRIRWAAPSLGILADWLPRFPVVSQKLYEGDRGGVVWECLASVAHARVRIGAFDLRGVGYVERLTLDLASWEMPVAELRWGRFLAPDTSLVWIDWRGSPPFRLVLRDGVADHNVSLGDTVIRGGDWRLDLRGRPAAHRIESLPSVLPAFPRIAQLSPERVTGARESRWFTRGILTGHRSVRGSVIQEVLRWSARVAA